MIVSDDQGVPALWQPPERHSWKALRMLPPVLPHGEATKSFQNLPVLYGAMLDAGIARSDLVIALGGGRDRRPGRICGRKFIYGASV